MKRINLFLSLLLFGTPACAESDGVRRRVGFAAAWSLAGSLSQRRDLPCLKPWWHSKTVWLNAIVASCLVAETNVASLQGLLPDNTYKIVAFALPIVNIWLRGFATQGLSFKPRAPDVNGEAP